MTQTNPIVDALAAHQRAVNWTDEQVADRIGISRQAWNFLRRGERRPDRKTLLGIGGGFPHLQAAVSSFLTPDWKKVAAMQPIRTAEKVA